MGDLQFNIYFCWMSEETFSEQIMIYKPISTLQGVLQRQLYSNLKLPLSAN